MKEISLNFGAIKESVLKIGAKDFLQANRLSVDSFLQEIKENPILRKQEIVFEAFKTNKSIEKERLADRFIQQTTQIFEGVDFGVLTRENRNIRIKYLDNSHVGSTSKNDKLYNAIHQIIECKCLGNGNYEISKEQEAFEILKTYLQEKKEQVMEQKDEPELKWDAITEMAYSKFNERYGHLSESDKKTLHILTSKPYVKIAHLLNLKESLLNKIDVLKKNNPTYEESKLLSIYEQKIKKVDCYDYNLLDDAILSFDELNQKLK